MIISVTLNPSIDKTLRIDNFSVNHVFRAHSVRQNPGGKGINVSRAAARLNGSTKALFLSGGPEGRIIKDGLKNEGINYLSVEVPGQSRTCYGIIDIIKNTETVINEPGPAVTDEALSSIISLFEETITSDDFAALSGSAPPGVRDTIYHELIAIAHRKKARAVVDTSGSYLQKAVDAIPFMVKINKVELENLFHCSITHEYDIIDKSRVLINKGIETVIVTQGADKVIALKGEHCLTVKPPCVDVVNSWGSGDSFVAGLLFSLDKGDDFKKALAYGVAAGAQNTVSYGAGFIDRTEVEELAEKVHVEGR